MPKLVKEEIIGHVKPPRTGTTVSSDPVPKEQLKLENAEVN